VNKPAEQFKKIVEYTLPWLVLAILLFHSYIYFFQHPYGFSWLPDGSINRVYVQQPAPTLMVGDRLMQVGSLSWDAFQSDLRKAFFEGVKAGEITPVTVERSGQLMTIPWNLPGFNRGELLYSLTSQWFLAYSFWIAGLLTVMFLRPKDERWWLFLAFDFVTAIWLVAGSGLSNFHLWYSALVLRMAIWLSLPVYLHLHWVFPRSLGKLPRPLVGAGYMIALVLMIAQWFQRLPGSLYLLGFLIAILGSLILLIVHFFRQVEMRRELVFMSILGVFAFLPAIALGAAYGLNNSLPQIDTLALIGFAMIPFSYLYLAFRRQVGGLEGRVNRIVSAYFFLILLGMIGIPILAVAGRMIPSSDNILIVGSVSAILVAVASIGGFPRFKTFVEKRLLGIRLPPENLVEIYSTRITSTIILSNLLQLLKDEVLPSLLIRQFAFIKLEKNSPKILFASDKTEGRIPDQKELTDLLDRSGKYRSLESRQNASCPWVRLVLPLRIGDDLIGLWLLGRHDPDDIYSRAEIDVLQALANETAVALSNILQTERLRALYMANIDRYEQERLRLSLELHDTVLNELAVLSMSLNPDAVPRNFQSAYETVTQRLREIVTDLRPPMLDYGLKLAIEGLADSVMERSNDGVNVITDLRTEGEARYAENIEHHLFRIVQQACENALRHSHATQIKLSATLTRERISLMIEDNGIGLPANEHIELDDLLASKHFGLAGIIERAAIIGARVEIDSSPQMGTQVRIAWNMEDAES